MMLSCELTGTDISIVVVSPFRVSLLRLFVLLLTHLSVQEEFMLLLLVLKEESRQVKKNEPSNIYPNT
jgi:hypothetical protein